MDAQRLDERRQRRVEVLVVAHTELVTCHLRPPPEAAVVGVEGDQLGTLGGGEHGRRLRVAELPERLLDRRPVERREPGLDVRGDTHAIIGSGEAPESGDAARRALRARIPGPRRARPRAALLLTGLYGAGARSGCTPSAPRVADARAHAPRLRLGPGRAERAWLARSPPPRPSAGALRARDRRRRLPARCPDQVAPVRSPSPRWGPRLPHRSRPTRPELLLRPPLRG